MFIPIIIPIHHHHDCDCDDKPSYSRSWRPRTPEEIERECKENRNMLIVAACLFLAFITAMFSSLYLFRNYYSSDVEYDYVKRVQLFHPEFTQYLIDEGYLSSKSSYLDMDKYDFWHISTYIRDKDYMTPYYIKYGVETYEELTPLIEPKVEKDSYMKSRLDIFVEAGLGRDVVAFLNSDGFVTQGEWNILEAKRQKTPSLDKILESGLALYGNLPAIKAVTDPLLAQQAAIWVRDTPPILQLLEQHVLTEYSKYQPEDDYTYFLRPALSFQRIDREKLIALNDVDLNAMYKDFMRDTVLTQGEYTLLDNKMDSASLYRYQQQEAPQHAQAAMQYAIDNSFSGIESLVAAFQHKGFISNIEADELAKIYRYHWSDFEGYNLDPFKEWFSPLSDIEVNKLKRIFLKDCEPAQIAFTEANSDKLFTERDKERVLSIYFDVCN